VRDLPSYSGDDTAFRGWAATIARHRAVDHLRHRDRRPAMSGPTEALTELPAGEDAEAMALDTISTDAAVRLIATLPRDQAEAVMLRVVLGLDAKAAGRVLGKRPGAVRTAAYRGLQRLADRIAAAEAPVTSENRARVTHLAAATVKEAR
jgi:RNA polymerase sigma-70 factor (ECF subfamily)